MFAKNFVKKASGFSAISIKNLEVVLPDSFASWRICSISVAVPDIAIVVLRASSPFLLRPAPGLAPPWVFFCS